MENKDVLMAKKLALEVRKAGGRAYFVGGYVRDILRQVDNADIDIEVHLLEPQILEQILDSLGNRLQYGESFGIYSLSGYNLDIAIPRKEALSGVRHSDFDIYTDPYLGTYYAASRRDFTINSLLQDILTGDVIDHFGGVEDIANKVIRHTNSEKFAEDALRVLRGAQFAARFDYAVSEETLSICKGIRLNNLSSERVEGELKKALLKSSKPSVFFEVLYSMKQLDIWFPEVKRLRGIPQDPKYHPEGDVWSHTMKVIDSAVKYRDKAEDSYGFMLSALCHDFGKIVCTEEINGRIHAYNHETEGIQLVNDFLGRIVGKKQTRSYVTNMVEMHMRPYAMANDESSVKGTNRMFDNSVSPIDLIYLSLADNSLKEGTEQFEVNKEFLFQRYSIYISVMEADYVRGSDLIEAGFKPGTEFRQMLEFSHKLRIAGIDKARALKETISYGKKLIKNQ